MSIINAPHVRAKNKAYLKPNPTDLIKLCHTDKHVVD